MNRLMIAMFLLIALFTSCDLADDMEKRGGSIIHVSAAIQELAFPLQANFAQGDAISIYAYQANRVAKVLINNSVNTFDGASWQAAPAMSWENSLINYDFLAIYPARAITDFTATDFTLDDEVAKNDLLVATSKNIPMSGAEKVELQFEHIMSKLTVVLTYATGFEPEAVIERVVLKAKNSAQIDFTTKQVTAMGTSADLDLKKIDNNRYFCIVPPQTIASASQMIRVYFQGDRTPYIHTTVADVELQAKKERTITLTVEPRIITELRNNAPNP